MDFAKIRTSLQPVWVDLTQPVNGEAPVRVQIVPGKMRGGDGPIWERQVCTEAFLDFDGMTDGGNDEPENSLENRLLMLGVGIFRDQIQRLCYEKCQEILVGEDDAASD